MKLATYADADSGTTRGAVVLGDQIVDLAGLLDDGEPVTDIGDLLRRDYDAQSVVRAKLDGVGTATTGTSLATVTLLPPILRPSTIRDHIAFEEHATRQFTREVADVWRRRPIHYYSNTSQLLGDGAGVVKPETERLDFELEIAAVIADECSDLSEDDAMEHVLGFTIMNDWSARDLQADEMAYGLGPAKGKDFASSFGPWIVSADELEPFLNGGVLDLRCTVSVNGELWAEGNARAQFHTWGAMLAHASQDSRLLPGDLIASGTVGGCSIGEAIRKGYSARYLLEGDAVELEVEGIGLLRNTVVTNPRRGRAGRYRAEALPPMPIALSRNNK